MSRFYSRRDFVRRGPLAAAYPQNRYPTSSVSTECQIEGAPYGYAASNNPVDTLVQVLDDLNLLTGAMRYQSGAWVPYATPLTWSAYPAQVLAALVDSDTTILRCYENAVAVPTICTTYRKALRTMVGGSSGDPTKRLLTKPTYPTGTYLGG